MAEILSMINPVSHPTNEPPADFSALRALKIDENMIECRNQKMPYGLFRASHFPNPAKYSDIVGYTPHFYPHIWAGH